jgi:RNA polymerase sigma factor (TIGR02999 family)
MSDGGDLGAARLLPPLNNLKNRSPHGHDGKVFFARLTPGCKQSAMTDPSADQRPEEIRPAAELLPEVYAELRRLAAALTVRLQPGQTLQPTALVHEAYLRLVRNQDPGWEGRRHFFGAAAQAMREILIEQARRKDSLKRGGGAQRLELSEGLALIEPPADDLLALDEAIGLLQAEKPHLAEIVMLRYYTGLSVEETAGVVGRSVSTVVRDWRFARAWLAGRIGADAMGREKADD